MLSLLRIRIRDKVLPVAPNYLGKNYGDRIENMWSLLRIRIRDKVLPVAINYLGKNYRNIIENIWLVWWIRISNPTQSSESLANYLNSVSITQIFYLHLIKKLNNFQWCEICGYKKG